ncbi:MAG: hypothetical protein ACI4Q8_01550 [Ruminococcus sp.]
MKNYETPELELVRYDVEDCLTGSTEIPKETEDIGGILDDLI